MKQMNKIVGSLLGGVLMLGALALPTAAAAENDKAQMKVVMQVSDANPATWNLALNNAKNFQAATKGEAKIEIVAYGPGIGMLTADSEVADRVSEAADSGVKVAACGNTMKAKKLTKADMNSKVDIVPAGVVEIVTREMEGYSYIRP
ncbi:MAG: DsrE family protein [Hydrogenophilales bacterium]|nr:DsrE family protein [Hydrogenophilales bacterium]